MAGGKHFNMPVRNHDDNKLSGSMKLFQRQIQAANFDKKKKQVKQLTLAQKREEQRKKFQEEKRKKELELEQKMREEADRRKKERMQAEEEKDDEDENDDEEQGDKEVVNDANIEEAGQDGETKEENEEHASASNIHAVSLSKSLEAQRQSKQDRKKNAEERHRKKLLEQAKAEGKVVDENATTSASSTDTAQTRQSKDKDRDFKLNGLDLPASATDGKLKSNKDIDKIEYQSKMLPGESWKQYSKRIANEKAKFLKETQVQIHTLNEKKKQKLNERKEKQMMAKLEKVEQKRDEFINTETIRFGEVVDRPPTLTAVPKAKKNLAGHVLNVSSLMNATKQLDDPSSSSSTSATANAANPKKRKAADSPSSLQDEEEKAKEEERRKANQRMLEVMREKAQSAYKVFKQKKQEELRAALGLSSSSDEVGGVAKGGIKAFNAIQKAKQKQKEDMQMSALKRLSRWASLEDD